MIFIVMVDDPCPKRREFFIERLVKEKQVYFSYEDANVATQKFRKMIGFEYKVFKLNSNFTEVYLSK